MVILSDGRIVSGSQDKTLRVWDLNTGACDVVLKGHKGVRTMCIYYWYISTLY